MTKSTALRANIWKASAIALAVVNCLLLMQNLGLRWRFLPQTPPPQLAVGDRVEGLEGVTFDGEVVAEYLRENGAGIRVLFVDRRQQSRHKFFVTPSTLIVGKGGEVLASTSGLWAEDEQAGAERAFRNFASER